MHTQDVWKDAPISIVIFLLKRAESGGSAIENSWGPKKDLFVFLPVSYMGYNCLKYF